MGGVPGPALRGPLGQHESHYRGSVLSAGAQGPPGPFLDFEPDPAVWLVGPTPERPVEEWIPVATAAQAEFFGLAEDQLRAREHVADILGSTARSHPSPLPYFLLRWRELAEVPLALFLGVVNPGEEDDLAGHWLSADDATTVEPPIRDDLEAPEGMWLGASLIYSLTEEAGVVVSVRYVVDTGHPGGIVLAHAASDAPAEILAAREDIVALLRTVTITDTPR